MQSIGVLLLFILLLTVVTIQLLELACLSRPDIDVQLLGTHADASCCGDAGRRIGEIPERGDPGQQHLQMISAHVSAYITHVRTQLKQTIPKAIVHCLVSLGSLAQRSKQRLVALLWPCLQPPAESWPVPVCISSGSRQSSCKLFCSLSLH